MNEQRPRESNWVHLKIDQCRDYGTHALHIRRKHTLITSLIYLHNFFNLPSPFAVYINC